LAKTRLIQETELRMLHQTGGFQGKAIQQCGLNLLQTAPVAMATEIWGF